MRPKIKVMARDDVQLRVFARNNAIPSEKLARLKDMDSAQNLKPDVVYCLPKWEEFSASAEMAREWKRRGGRFVNVPVAVVLGRAKMKFTAAKQAKATGGCAHGR
jgi:hypothetical protein